MQITLKKHGGHTAGMRQVPKSIDVDTLEHGSATKVTELVTAALQSPPAATSRAVADAISYSIIIDQDNGSTTLKQSDASMSAPFAELLEFLEQLE